MRRTLMLMLSGSLALAAAALSPRVSHAHINLNAPAPRHGGPNDQKTRPCGAPNSARSDNVTVFAPGETITVEWDETIDHPGHYRIMFDEDGFDFPEPANERDLCVPGEDPGCLADNIPDRRGGGAYSVQVTLPDVECENCTLQLIQVMTDRTPATLYYRCADLALRASSSGEGSTASSATSTSTGPDAASGTGTGGTSATGSGGASATGTGGADATGSVAASTGTGSDVASGTGTGSVVASGAGSTGTGQAVGGGAPGPGEGPDGSEDDGGCSFGGAGSGPIPAALGALALLSLAARGRRRTPRSRP